MGIAVELVSLDWGRKVEPDRGKLVAGHNLLGTPFRAAQPSRVPCRWCGHHGSHARLIRRVTLGPKNPLLEGDGLFCQGAWSARIEIEALPAPAGLEQSETDPRHFRPEPKLIGSKPKGLPRTRKAL